MKENDNALGSLYVALKNKSHRKSDEHVRQRTIHPNLHILITTRTHAISKSRQTWNEAPEQLIQNNDVGGKSNNHQYNVRKPRKSDGDLNFEQYKRGQVDKLYF